MKMKYIFPLFLILLLGCEDPFSNNANKYLTIDNEQEKVDLINGIYSRLVRVHNNYYFSLLCRSDDINIYNNYAFSNEYGGCSSNGGTTLNATTIGEAYVNLYSAIVNANNLLCLLSVTDDAQLVGEIYFLRSYCYFKLARLFGTPPLVLDVDVNYQLQKPTYAEVYQLIEADMLQAIDLLPDTYKDARIPGETPHKGTAKAMLAEIYLAMAGFPINDQSKYAEAAKLSGEVIEKATYYNMELIPDLANLKTNSNEHCNEHLFSLFIKNENNTDAPMSNSHVFIDPFSGATTINSFYKLEFKFFKDFPNNYRKNVTIKTGEYQNIQFETPDTTYSFLKYHVYDPLVDPCEYIQNVGYLKWVNYDDLDDTEAGNLFFYKQGSHVTIYLLRYAQTLLTYAESKARSGNLDQSAFEAVNKIRRRANKLDINTPSIFDLPSNLTNEQFLDSVVWERAWELSSEPDGRWFDIIRLNLKDELKNYRYKSDLPAAVDKNLITEDWYFYKIPQEDRWINPNFN